MTPLPPNLAWLLLICAGLFEIGWPLGFKLTSMPTYRIAGFIIAFVCISISGILLWMAQKTIPIGTAYAVWTGIGTMGTFMLGVMYFGDAASLNRYLGVALILLGVIILQTTSS